MSNRINSRAGLGKPWAIAVTVIAVLVVATASRGVWRSPSADQPRGAGHVVADEHDHDHHAHDEHDHDALAHDDPAHDEHDHDEHAHDEHSHDEHAYDEHAHDEHAHDQHDHEDQPGQAHDEANSITLTAAGLKNIGYEPFKVELADYQLTQPLPALVVERPGRSQVQITAPLTGIVTEIDVTEGEAIEPGRTMFAVRLNHEELVAAQRDFLAAVENLAIVEQEIKRLDEIGNGVVAGKRILDQQYERRKLEASLKADQQALLLHGLTKSQIETIRTTRQLLQTLDVAAPEYVHEGEQPSDHLFHVQQLAVVPGQQVELGQQLCVLADHCELYVEGQAFEDDVIQLREAMRSAADISADVLLGSEVSESVDDLKMLYLSDHIDPDSRAFRFYLRLPNRVVLDTRDSYGIRFMEWRFKPGQRMELQLPVEKWEQQFVLPSEAVVEQGAEAYVYRQHGKHFDRLAVHLLHRDRKSAVVANDGSLKAGAIVAGRGAYQIHLALKNKSGPAIDPHAGHNH